MALLFLCSQQLDLLLEIAMIIQRSLLLPTESMHFEVWQYFLIKTWILNTVTSEPLTTSIVILWTSVCIKCFQGLLKTQHKIGLNIACFCQILGIRFKFYLYCTQGDQVKFWVRTPIQTEEGFQHEMPLNHSLLICWVTPAFYVCSSFQHMECSMSSYFLTPKRCSHVDLLDGSVFLLLLCEWKSDTWCL